MDILVTCAALATVENGEIAYTGGATPPVSVGVIGTVTCSDGFTFSGTDMYTCLSTGDYNPATLDATCTPGK